MRRKAATYRPLLGGEIAIDHPFQQPPYGGSNQFLIALRGEIERRGYRVAPSRVTRRTRAVLLNAFLADERVAKQASGRGVRVVHRVVGPVSVYRGVDDGTDRSLVDLNERYADATIFQSHYSLEAMRAQGFEFRDPTVIHNAVDGLIFHPVASPARGSRIRLIATSWSENLNKGFDVYQRLDEELDFGRFELTFVGRSPVRFRNIRMIPPVASHELADLLRAHDGFVFASRHESCSNALLEALACGLPAVYVESGSNAELVRGGGLAFGSVDDVVPAIEQLVDELDDRRARIRVTALAEIAERYLETMGLDSSA